MTLSADDASFDTVERYDPETLAGDPTLAPEAAPVFEAEPAQVDPVVVEEVVVEAVADRREALRAKKAARVQGLLEGRILHDGLMIIIDSAAGNYPNLGKEIARVNIRDIKDPESFIMSL